MSEKFLRHPKHYAERRDNQGFWGRSCRSKIPNAWDDEQWRRCQRSWKKHRKTQYKGGSNV